MVHTFSLSDNIYELGEVEKNSLKIFVASSKKTYICRQKRRYNYEYNSN